MGRILTEELLDKIDQYLKGELSELERLSFEKLLQEDEQLQEDVIIQKQLFAMHGTSTTDISSNETDFEAIALLKEKLKTDEYLHLSNKIRTIGNENRISNGKPRKRKTHYLNYFIAASVTIFFATLFFFNSESSLESYYSENVNWENLPSFIDKGNALDNFTKGEIAFKKKEYKSAILSFENIETTNELYPYSLMYIGASYDVLNENEKALDYFNKLSQLTEFEEHTKGFWYQLLIHLKLDNKEKANEISKIILKDKNNYNYQETQNMKL